MAYSIVKRGAFYAGPEDSFGAGSSNLMYFRLTECKLPVGREYREGAEIKQDDARDPGQFLEVADETNLKGELHPNMAEWPNSQMGEGALVPDVYLLEAAFGSHKAGGYGVLKASGSSATVLQFPDGEHDETPTTMGFKAGEWVYVRTPSAANIMGAQTIAKVDDVLNQLTLTAPLPATPAASSIVYGGASLPKQAITTPQSYELIDEGSGNWDRRQALGAVLKSLKIVAPYGGIPTIETTLWCARPIQPQAGEEGAAPGVEAWPWEEAKQVLHGGLYIWDGSENRKIDRGFEINVENTLGPVGGINDLDPNGYVAVVRTKQDITVKLEPSYEDNDLYGWMDAAPTAMVVTGWFGAGPGVWSFQVRAGVLVAVPDDGEDESVKTTPIVIGDGTYSGDTGTFGATDAGNKSFCMGCLAGETE
jgi:hypothetical protein